jgi:hypothetical protein
VRVSELDRTAALACRNHPDEDKSQAANGKHISGFDRPLQLTVVTSG